jgi:hypothetical protein
MMMTIYINNNLNDNTYSYRNLAKRNPHAYRKPSSPKQTTSSNADDVWAASWQAYVTNGNKYIKVPAVSGTNSNRTIVDQLLADTTQITNESREQADQMRRYFKGLTFKVIEGKALSPFMQSAFEAASKDEITSKYDLAVIVSLPATYEKATKRDDVDRRIQWARGGNLGSIGDKVVAEIEIVKQVWSQNWNTWYVTGLTDDDKVVFFSYKKQTNIGDRVKIQGTVKEFRDNSTQLSRVKVIV